MRHNRWESQQVNTTYDGEETSRTQRLQRARNVRLPPYPLLSEKRKVDI